MQIPILSNFVVVPNNRICDNEMNDKGFEQQLLNEASNKANMVHFNAIFISLEYR